MTDYSAIPDAMKSHDQWIVWKTQVRDGDPTKMPLDPSVSTLPPASSTDPETWTDFETTRDVAVRRPVVDGLGFVFTAEDNFVGIDLDDVVHPERGGPETDAADIITTLNSYTERSPSGTGYHIIALGQMPAGYKHKGELDRDEPMVMEYFDDPPHVEWYDQKRFFTMTGDRVGGDIAPTIEERSDELEQVAEQYLPERDVEAERAKATADPVEFDPESVDVDVTIDIDLDDRQIRSLAQQAKNGQKFARLWRGHTSGYKSQSEADMALCIMLAFWTQKDPQQMDRLFRDSGLMRPKWDEDRGAVTYGERTIREAILRQNEVYDPAPSFEDDEAEGGDDAEN